MMRKSKTTDIAPMTDTGIARRDPSTDPLAWFREMDTWFDDVRRTFERSWGLAPFASGLAEVREPALDLRDNGAEFVVTAELPGVPKDGVEVDVAPEGLEIRAEVDAAREEEDRGYFLRERNYRSFHRALSLPAAVSREGAVAKLENGVLEVRLPKREPTPAPKTVKVKVQ